MPPSLPIAEIIAKVSQGYRQSKDLTWGEAKAVMNGIIEGRVTPAQLGALIVGLHIKVESVTEIAAFSGAARDYVAPFPSPVGMEILDLPVYAEHPGRMHILLPSVVVAVSCGVRILMHGAERANDSCAPASLLRALGISSDCDVPTGGRLITETGFAYLDLGMFHPPLHRHLETASTLGVASFFLPVVQLLNPGRSTRHLVGISDAHYFQRLGEAFRMLNCERALIVHGNHSVPLLSVTEPVRILEVTPSIVRPYTMRPSDVGLPTWSDRDVAGGSGTTGPEGLERVLTKAAAGAYKDAVMLNAAAMLYAGGRTSSIRDGVPMAREAIDSGSALAALNRMRQQAGC